MSVHTRLFAVVVSVSVFLDQVTKYLARDAMKLRERIEVIPGFFNLTHQENPGAAWGILGDSEYRLVFFSIITLVAFVVIIGYFRKLKSSERTLAWGLSLIFSGAAGNFIDRMSPRHTVTDFLDFYASGSAAPLVRKVLGSAHWPAFNVADAGITVGAAMLVLESLFARRERPKNRDGTSDMTDSGQ